MIRISLLSGPHAGQQRASADIPADVDPVDLMVDLARHQWRWQIDWSAATSEELLLWGPADLVGRIFAAALAHRTVRFMGQRWDFADVDADSQEFAEMIGEIEDTIVDSGRNVGVLSDDWASDLVIGIHGYESNA